MKKTEIFCDCCKGLVAREDETTPLDLQVIHPDTGILTHVFKPMEHVCKKCIRELMKNIECSVVHTKWRLGVTQP